MNRESAEAAPEYRKMAPSDYRRLLGEACSPRVRATRKRIAQLQAMEQRYGDAALYQYGEIYAQLGLADQAFRGTGIGTCKVRDPGMAASRVDPFLDPIRRDPRFAIEAKLNFPQI